MLARLSYSLAAALAASLPGQNLVANGDFESFTSCPTASGQLALAPPWYSPNGQTPDYMNACSSFTPSVPNNFYGNQLAHSGQAYAAAIAYFSQATVREYAGGQLSTPLVAGHTYQVSFWVSLADNSNWAVVELGAHLKVGPHAGPINTPLPNTPQVQFTGPALTDETNWVLVSGTFTAAGGEDHIAVGNFQTDANTTTQFVGGGLNNFAVYYIDDVSVVDLTSGSGCDVQIIGWSDMPSPTTLGYLDVQDVANCLPATTRCRTQIPVQALAAYAGGTAYDPRYRTAWVSDGAVLAEYSVDPNRLCASRCPPFRATLSDPQALVSGLCASDRLPRLFQLATRPGYMELTTYDNSGRCPDRPVTCRRNLPTGAVAAGLAYDEVEDLLFISMSTPTAVGWQNLLWVAPASSPCTPICETRFYSCNTNLVVGLAFDACTRTLYATDGQETQTIGVIDARRCQVRIGSCCRKQLAPTYRGLATIPCWQSRSVGRACTSAPCPSCPSMHIGSTGDPSLGTAFTVTLSDAPANSTAYLFVSVGPCGAGLPLPRPFCGVLFPDLATGFVLPPAPISGLPPCSGSAAQSLPLPVDPNLCGQALCTQWIVVCPNFGFATSDALEFTVTGS